jgi:hypothetical protein
MLISFLIAYGLYCFAFLITEKNLKHCENHRGKFRVWRFIVFALCCILLTPWFGRFFCKVFIFEILDFINNP